MVAYSDCIHCSHTVIVFFNYVTEFSLHKSKGLLISFDDLKLMSKITVRNSSNCICYRIESLSPKLVTKRPAVKC